MSYTVGDGMVVASLAAGVVGYYHIQHKTRQKRLEIIHQERLVAMEKGIPLPELPLDPVKEPSQPDPTILPIMGVVLFTLALGAMVALFFVLPSFWVAPMPFAFLGVGLLAFYILKGSAGR
ncbi:hypothetical protein EON81_00955 [bacterium]|nr:MAG: hypothetical protein EON81_00955 [bacterium]